jgi:hypothetical protein
MTTSVIDCVWLNEPLVAVTVGAYVPVAGCPPLIVSVAATPCEPGGTVTVVGLE